MMPTLPTTRREDGAPSNWDRYLDLLAHRGVPEKMRSWYVRQVEGFLKARRPASLAQVTAEEIAGYLQEVSAQAQLADWQFCRERSAYPTGCLRNPGDPALSR